MSPGGFGGGGFTTTTSTITSTTTTIQHSPPLPLAEEQPAAGFADLELTKLRQNKVSLRNHFPENWLFDFFYLSDSAATHLR